MTEKAIGEARETDSMMEKGIGKLQTNDILKQIFKENNLESFKLSFLCMTGMSSVCGESLQGA